VEEVGGDVSPAANRENLSADLKVYLHSPTDMN
jgi:hypothetical protein